MKWVMSGVWIAMLEAWQLLKYLFVFGALLAMLSLLYLLLMPVLLTWIGATGVGLLVIGVLILLFILK